VFTRFLFENVIELNIVFVWIFSVRDVGEACSGTTICADPDSSCVADTCQCNGPTYIADGLGGCKERKHLLHHLHRYIFIQFDRDKHVRYRQDSEYFPTRNINGLLVILLWLLYKHLIRFSHVTLLLTLTYVIIAKKWSVIKEARTLSSIYDGDNGWV
jgi:hypothetical protein